MIKKFSSLRGWDLKKFPLNRVRFTLSTDKALWKHRRRKLAISEASQVCAGSQMYLSPCDCSAHSLGTVAAVLGSKLTLSACELLPEFSSESCDAFSFEYRRCLLIFKGLRQRNQPRSTHSVSKGSSYLWYSGIHLLQRFISSVFFLFSSVSGDMQL